MLRRDHLPHMLGAATLALLFAAASVHPQATSGSAGSPGGATKNAAPSTGGAPGGTAQAGGGAATADKATTAPSAAAGKLSKADAGMLRDMSNINVSEMATAKIAQDKSKDEHVIAYAKQMIDDHSKAQSDLTQLAQKKGVTLPTEPDKKHQAAAKKLSGLSGDAFDRAYIKQAGIQDHTEARKVVMRARDKATDPDVKGAAEKMLPTVEQHLKMAKELPVAKKDTSGAPGAAGAPSKPDTSGGQPGAPK